MDTVLDNVLMTLASYEDLTSPADQEVVGYYDDGMRVPDDVTLLWTDDKYVANKRSTQTHLDFESAGETSSVYLFRMNSTGLVELVFIIMCVFFQHIYSMADIFSTTW